MIIDENKEINIEILPKIGERIDWINSIGYIVDFKYFDIVGKIKILEYDKQSMKITIDYNDKKYIISTISFKKVGFCNLFFRNTKFKVKIGQTFKDDKRDLTIIDKEYRLNKNGQNCKYYKYKCNKCGYNEGWIRENHLLNNTGCSCCNGKTVVKGINDIATTHPELVKYFVNIEVSYTHTYNSGEKVLCKCPYCGTKKINRIDLLYHKGFSCSKCGDGISYPNKFMFNLLEQLNVNFETEYSPKWINNKKYDFYIPSKQLIIEMDGSFHKKDNKMNGQTKEESKEIDNYKDEMALKHGIQVIRIDCNYYNLKDRFYLIKNNIIESKLNKIFNFNNIDWDIIIKNSEKSKLVECCNLWNDNKSILEISKIEKIDIHTVREYLKKGNKINLCNYIPKEETNKKIRKMMKSVNVFKNNKYLGNYDSIGILVEKSISDFKIQFFRSGISRVLNGTTKQYKGFRFEYAQ